MYLMKQPKKLTLNRTIDSNVFSILVLLLCVLSIGANAGASSFNLSNERIAISFDDNGAIAQLENRITDTKIIKNAGDVLWRLGLEDQDRKPHDVFSNQCSFDISQKYNVIQFQANSIPLDGKSLNITITCTFELSGDELHCSAYLANNSEFQINSFDFPMIGGIGNMDASKNFLYWPNRPGERYLNPAELKNTFKGQYPCGMSMQWFEYGNDTQGLYFASLDQSLQTTGMSVVPEPDSKTLTFGMTKYPFIGCGEQWNSANYVISPHVGDWHTSADRYRRWAKTWMRQQSVPDWIQKTNGWFLVILKQQNGNLMWRYPEIPQILPIAKKEGLDFLSLFGWGIGGHDHLYPDYSPDPNMGNAVDIRASIEAVHRNGGKVVLYTNGQLVDTTADYYQTIGKKYAAMQWNGEHYTQHWKKYKNHSGYKHALMCQTTQEWSNKMLELAEYIHGLGSDGVMYDQIGMGSAPFCFDPTHNHNSPALATGPGILHNFQRIQEHFRTVDPDFAVLSEGVTDAFGHFVDFTHGSGRGYMYNSIAFPALFRYTFPEIIITNRYPSPIMDVDHAKFAFINGMRFDVESRYIPDVLLLKEGKRPSTEDYQEITGPPVNKEFLLSGNIDQYTNYMNQLCQIRRDYPILLKGQFIDNQGFQISDKEIEARAFVLNDEMAVVCWNHSTTSKTCIVSAKHYSMQKILIPNLEETDYKQLQANQKIVTQPNQVAVFLFQSDSLSL